MLTLSADPLFEFVHWSVQLLLIANSLWLLVTLVGFDVFFGPLILFAEFLT